MRGAKRDLFSFASNYLQHFSSTLSASLRDKTHTEHQISEGIMQASIFAFHAPPPALPINSSPFSLKTHQPNTLLFTSTLTNRVNPPLSTRTPSRKLRFKPLAGKYLREDYLVKKLSAKEVQDLVKGERNVPLIIDFYATWCGPCVLMAQELEMLAVEYESNALIVKVDTDDEYEFARDMQVRGLPTVYFISPNPNKDAIRTEGLIPIQMMRDIINNDM